MIMSPEELQAKLRDLSRETIPAIEKGMEKAALNVEARAKANCTPGQSPYYKAPHITGTMRRSIGSEVKVRGNEVRGIVHAGGEEASYAEDVHEGTSGMPPRPYILDAIIEEENMTTELLGAAVERGIDKHARGD